MSLEPMSLSLHLLTIVLLSLATTGCGGSKSADYQLTEAGRNVQLMKSDPPPGCEEVATINGDASGAGASIGERSRIVTRNKAGALGANYVRMDTVDRYGIVTGVAYRCPQSAISP